MAHQAEQAIQEKAILKEKRVEMGHLSRFLWRLPCIHLLNKIPILLDDFSSLHLKGSCQGSSLLAEFFRDDPEMLHLFIAGKFSVFILDDAADKFVNLLMSAQYLEIRFIDSL
jgi:hypothetical protein